MHKSHYRSGKSAFMALVSGAAALIAGWSWLDPDAGILSLAAALVCGLAAVKLGMNAMSDAPAIAFDSDALRIRRTWGQTAVIPWNEVQGIAVEVLTTRYWGIIPISRNENLVVRCDGGMFGARRLRIALKLVQLPPGGAGQLVAMLTAAQVAAVGEAGVAMAGAGRHGWGAKSVSLRTDPEAGGDFDADAALARYLARKEAGAVEVPSASMPAAPVQPAAPPRPVFGRKTQAG